MAANLSLFICSYNLLVLKRLPSQVSNWEKDAHLTFSLILDGVMSVSVVNSLQRQQSQVSQHVHICFLLQHETWPVLARLDFRACHQSTNDHTMKHT